MRRGKSAMPPPPPLNKNVNSTAQWEGTTAMGSQAVQLDTALGTKKLKLIRYFKMGLTTVIPTAKCGKSPLHNMT